MTYSSNIYLPNVRRQGVNLALKECRQWRATLAIDGIIPVIPFVNRDIYRPRNMGSTNLADALRGLKQMSEE